MHGRISTAFFSPTIEKVKLDSSLSFISCLSTLSDGNMNIYTTYFCVIEEQESTDTTLTVIHRTHIKALNWYINIIEERECRGFSSVTPIGYGLCKSMPYQENVLT